ncbi:MAG: phosphatase PAP2 family protein [Bacteroidota bacterium]
MLDSLLQLDRDLALAINGHHAPWLDSVMIFLSLKHTYVFYLPIAWLIMRKSSWKEAGIVVLGAIATVAVDDLVSTRIFKYNVARLRPCHEPSLQGLLNLPDGCGGQFGFISSHAANHFGLAMFLGLMFCRHYPGKLAYFFIFPVLVIYSRVYLAAHYPGDVICGGFLGVIVGGLFYKLFTRWLKPI